MRATVTGATGSETHWLSVATMVASTLGNPYTVRPSGTENVSLTKTYGVKTAQSWNTHRPLTSLYHSTGTLKNTSSCANQPTCTTASAIWP